MTVSAVSPWRTAFWRDLLLPSSVVGPVLKRALRRLASICRSEVIGLVVQIGFVSLFRAGRSIVGSEPGTIDAHIQFVTAVHGDLDGMGPAPERGSDAQWLDAVPPPPNVFIAVPMKFAV